LSLEARLITHEDVSDNCTLKVEVAVAAWDGGASGRKNGAVTVIVNLARPTIDRKAS